VLHVTQTNTHSTRSRRHGTRVSHCVSSWQYTYENAYHAGQSLPMRRLLKCFPPTVSPLRPRGAWHWSRCSGFMEHLTDRQATDAVRSRLDWKYALSLELTDPGCDHTVLSEFRSCLVAGNAEPRLLDLFPERCQEQGWLKDRGSQRTDSTHVLAKTRAN
jgi:Transposase domain (DUF772)